MVTIQVYQVYLQPPLLRGALMCPQTQKSRNTVSNLHYKLPTIKHAIKHPQSQRWGKNKSWWWLSGPIADTVKPDSAFHNSQYCACNPSGLNWSTLSTQIAWISESMFTQTVKGEENKQQRGGNRLCLAPQWLSSGALRGDALYSYNTEDCHLNCTRDTFNIATSKKRRQNRNITLAKSLYWMRNQA